jgi:ADP-ribose pyrophosphatase YjhB (NUDIX family)
MLNKMNITDAVKFLENQVPDPSKGLPDEIFYYISKTTPLVNVDLLIKDENNRVLMSWRDDKYSGTGWYLPGGIIRHKETLEERLQKVALTEIGARVDFDPTPLTFRQIIHNEREIRSHFISFLYKCSLNSSFIPDNKDISVTSPGYLMWHNHCPDNLLKCHEEYRKYL